MILSINLLSALPLEPFITLVTFDGIIEQLFSTGINFTKILESLSPYKANLLAIRISQYDYLHCSLPRGCPRTPRG